jgi:hypothetical protein
MATSEPRAAVAAARKPALSCRSFADIGNVTAPNSVPSARSAKMFVNPKPPRRSAATGVSTLRNSKSCTPNCPLTAK